MQTDQSLLRQTLALRGHQQVKLLRGDRVERISASAALFRALAGDYEWSGSAKRIKAMRAIKPDKPWSACWRNQEAAVLPPAGEYFLAMR